MTPTESPVARSKVDLESLVKQHGGAVFQSEHARKDIIVIADKGKKYALNGHLLVVLVRVASLMKRETHDILRPRWLLESIENGFALPIEPR